VTQLPLLVYTHRADLARRPSFRPARRWRRAAGD